MIHTVDSSTCCNVVSGPGLSVSVLEIRVVDALLAVMLAGCCWKEAVGWCSSCCSSSSGSSRCQGQHKVGVMLYRRGLHHAPDAEGGGGGG